MHARTHTDRDWFAFWVEKGAKRYRRGRERVCLVASRSTIVEQDWPVSADGHRDSGTVPAPFCVQRGSYKPNQYTKRLLCTAVQYVGVQPAKDTDVHRQDLDRYTLIQRSKSLTARMSRCPYREGYKKYFVPLQ